MIYYPLSPSLPIVKNEHSTDVNDNNSINNISEFEVNENDPFRILRNIKLKTANQLLLGHLNINSIKNKFEPLKMIIKGNLDLLVLTETNILF